MLCPTEDRLVVQRFEAAEKSPGGIVMSNSAEGKSQWARVIAVGPGRMMECGRRIPMPVEVGDEVLIAPYAPLEFERDNQKYVVVHSSDIALRFKADGSGG